MTHEDPDEYETVIVDDEYERSKNVVAMAAPMADIAGHREFEALLGFDEARWAEHDARVAKSKQREQAAQAHAARVKRAAMFKTNEYRFPAIAVDAAIAVWPSDTAAMLHARSFARGFERVLVLAGGTGVGKSSAATWIALEVGGSAPAFLRASELEARGRYDRDLRDWLRTRSMLVLDDLGAEALDGKGHFRSLLDEVFDSYYGDRKRVVITTNLRAKRDGRDEELQLQERYGERMISRLVEVGRWGDCGNRDLRREQHR